MAISRRKKPSVPLTEQLATKASELHESEEQEAVTSRSLAQLSAESAERGKVAAFHALAVERALGILADAGVK